MASGAVTVPMSVRSSTDFRPADVDRALGTIGAASAARSGPASVRNSRRHVDTAFPTGGAGGFRSGHRDRHLSSGDQDADGGSPIIPTRISAPGALAGVAHQLRADPHAPVCREHLPSGRIDVGVFRRDPPARDGRRNRCSGCICARRSFTTSCCSARSRCPASRCFCWRSNSPATEAPRSSRAGLRLRAVPAWSK